MYAACAYKREGVNILMFSICLYIFKYYIILD